MCFRSRIRSRADIAYGATISVGFNALTLEYVDMFKAGIIDPAKVVRSALVNAASIAGLLLTTDSMVTEFKDDKSKVEGSTV